MKIVYRAAHSTDAHLVRQLLEQEGMTAFVNGGLLEGGAGELPMGGLATVSVADEHEARALEVVREWERMPVPPEDEENDAARAPAAAAAPRRGRTTVLVAALLGAAFGALLTWGLVRKSVQVFGADLDGDREAEERVIYEDGMIARVEADRNRDGRVDQITNYGTHGQVTAGEADDDFDGYMENRYLHDYGNWRSSTIDLDADGETDYRAEAEHGVLASEEWLDARGRVVKRLRYTKGRPANGEYDSNSDGKLDTARRYDARGEIVASSPIAP